MDRLGAARAKAKAQQGHELSDMSTNGSTRGGALGPFFNEITAIQSLVSTLTTTTREIEGIHARLLGPLTPQETSEETSRLQNATDRVRNTSDEIKSRIKQLSAGDLAQYSASDRATMKNQTALVRQSFVKALQTYQSVEQSFQTKSKQRLERGYKTLNPSATPAEVKEFVEGQRQVQLLQGGRSDYATVRATANEVQQRQVELQRLERTLAELAQLFNDMAYMVQEQDQIFDNVQQTAEKVATDAEKGADHTEAAVVHARRARRMRWICFWIIVVVVVILALVLGLEFGLPAARAARKK